jgi:hypothetical protein
MNKCHPAALGIALGAVWALGLFALGVIASFADYGDAFVYTIGSVYPGYDSSFGGALIGALWGFVDAFVAGFVFGWIYNKALRQPAA